jgi:hypothetical protein
MDYRYDVHHLTYNGNLLHLMLTDGWQDLEKVFEFEGTRLLTFFYHGGDLFGIVQNVPIEKNSDIPFFHSRASVEHHTANFFVRLSSDSVDSPYLVFVIFVTCFMFKVLLPMLDIFV